jgi:hypothetical protein
MTSFAATLADQGGVIRYTQSERFFGTTFYKGLLWVRWVVVPAFLAMMATGIILALRMRPPKDIEFLFPPTHVISRFASAMDPDRGPFHASRHDKTAEVDVVLGLNDPFMEQRGVSRWDAFSHGFLIHDGRLDELFRSSAGREYDFTELPFISDR